MRLIVSLRCGVGCACCFVRSTHPLRAGARLMFYHSNTRLLCLICACCVSYADVYVGWQFLPAPFRPLMTDPASPIIDYYPLTFEIDMNGKKNPWEVPLVVQAHECLSAWLMSLRA